MVVVVMVCAVVLGVGGVSVVGVIGGDNVGWLSSRGWEGWALGGGSEHCLLFLVVDRCEMG